MRLRIAALCLLFGSTLRAADAVSAIESRMDAAAPAFHGATADVTMDTFESVLQDHTVEHGNMQMQRVNAKDVRAILTFTGQDSARTLSFQGKKLLIYYPKTKFYQEYDLGSKSQLLNQYLLLGFGSTGKDLAQNYDVLDGGPATVNGQTTTKIILTPKNPTTKTNLSKVELWFPADGANPVQQKFYQPDGNYRKVTYSNIKVNPPMAAKLVFQLPAGATKQQ